MWQIERLEHIDMLEEKQGHSHETCSAKISNMPTRAQTLKLGHYSKPLLLTRSPYPETKRKQATVQTVGGDITQHQTLAAH